jgi:hypothetical protein
MPAPETGAPAMSEHAVWAASESFPPNLEHVHFKILLLRSSSQQQDFKVDVL